MDGNGRWAEERGMDRMSGHAYGVEAVRATVRAAMQSGVRHLTMYAFSTENWSRPPAEVDALMDLLVRSLAAEADELAGQGVRLRAMGSLDRLPEGCREALAGAETKTSAGDKLDLTLALSYSGRWEIVEAFRKALVSGVAPGDVDEDTIRQFLAMPNLPDPELLIRTGGEQRISNFLLWQIAYTEFHFAPVFWPDFRESHFEQAIEQFRSRQRRFGKTGQQIQRTSS
jgi:undecaprenyl diphosphate synthase